MSVARIVAFDGTPVVGAAGMRAAIEDRGDGSFSTADGRRVSGDGLRRLIEDGYVTAVEPAIEAELREGVVVYRHREFVLPGLAFDEAITWSACGETEVTYLKPSAAVSFLERQARAARLLARAALAGRDIAGSRALARRGLVVVPGMRDSVVAASLYGVLLAAEIMEGRSGLVEREIGIMLDDVRAREAFRVAADELPRARQSTAAARRTERELGGARSVAQEVA